MGEIITLETLELALKGNTISIIRLREAMIKYLTYKISLWSQTYYYTDLPFYVVQRIANDVFNETFLQYLDKIDFKITEGISTPLGVFSKTFFNKSQNHIRKHITTLRKERDCHTELSIDVNNHCDTIEKLQVRKEQRQDICNKIVPMLKCKSKHKEILTVFFSNSRKYESVDFELNLRPGTTKSVVLRNKENISALYQKQNSKDS